MTSIDAALSELLMSTDVVCRQWAEQDEGPYRRGTQPRRRDLVEDRIGVPLLIGLLLVDAAGAPLTGHDIEVWHCDAFGRYSGYPPPPDGAARPTSASPEYDPERSFLRGRQPTDDTGTVEFATIYPGWYPGRTVHVHIIAHAGGRIVTSQLYFPENVTAEVFSRPPYSQRPNRDTTNDTDTIFPTGGEPAILEVRRHGDGYLPRLAFSSHRPSQAVLCTMMRRRAT